MRGFTATIKLGINANTKEEARKTVEGMLKALDLPVFLESVE